MRPLWEEEQIKRSSGPQVQRWGTDLRFRFRQRARSFIHTLVVLITVGTCPLLAHLCGLSCQMVQGVTGAV